ncbi:MAG: hypothetical protein IIT58_12615, partial [Treponema sp.]|nr:hypothetical protein [Treponema sp.]
YKSEDDINEIKQSYIDEYSDVTLYYKGLIALRKAYPEAFCYNTTPSANRIADGLIKFETGDFVVFFNSNSTSTLISNENQVEGKVITISNGIVEEASSKTTEVSVPALSTLIIKK